MIICSVTFATIMITRIAMKMMAMIEGNERSWQFVGTARKRCNTVSTGKDVQVNAKRFQETSKFNQWRTFVSHLRKSVKSQ